MPRRHGDAEPPRTTVPREHFDRLYAAKPDPWGLATEWYERRKYALTVAALPRERYRNAFEPGCSIGELTRLLAPRFDRLLAIDFAGVAVARARNAVGEFPHVRVEQIPLHAELPDDLYDLVVVSEILYYLSGEDLVHVLDGLLARLLIDGDVVAVHHRAGDRCHGYDGFNVHSALAARPELETLVHHDDESFVLDVLRRQ
jgi:SAM-dependent methyltransferase